MNGSVYLAAAGLALTCEAPLTAGGREAEFSRVADRIASYSSENDIEKVAVLSFEPKGGTSRHEADLVAETIASFLAGRDKPALIERALLEKVLREAGRYTGAGGDAADVKELRDFFSLDAIITGTVFGDPEKQMIITRMIDMRSGRVLLAERTEIERKWRPLSDMPDIDIEWDPAQWSMPRQDFRDALADKPKTSCAERRAKLGRLNSELVDAKARYWAGRMREPGFSIRGLTRNPGTEIKDPGVKEKFYSLLKLYYGSASPQAPAAGQLQELKKLMAEEDALHNECGYR